MALVVEDGSIVTGANTYATEAELNSHLAARGKFLSGNNGTAEQVLLQAMDYIETQNFLGDKSTKEQPLQWPREGVYIDGFLVDDDEIPNDLKLAQIEAATSIDDGNNPLDPLGRTTKREKVGDIEVEYTDDARDTTELVAVDARLSKLLAGGGGIGVITLSRT